MNGKEEWMVYTEEELELPSAGEASDTECKEEEEVMLYAPDEALVRCMNTFGRPDLPYLETLTGCGREELIEVLELYQNPMGYDLHQDPDKDWLTKELYVRNKHIPRLYHEALKMQEKYGIFKRNLRLLKELYPNACGLTAQDLPIGNRTIPDWLYGEIFKKMLGLMTAPKVTYNSDTMRYTVSFREPPSYIVNYYEYGIRAKGATEIIPTLMNGEELAVMDREEDPWSGRVRYVRNDAETLALLEKVKVIVSRFFEILSDLMSEAEVYDQISARYCETIGGYDTGIVDAGWVAAPGLQITPYPHQRRAIARITTQQVTAIIWDTGAGKTLAMIAGAAELKRLGISRKILFVVSNSTFTNFVAEAEKYYPEAHYLAIDPRSFSRRKQFYLDRIREGNYDAVIMASSSYNLIDMSRDYYLDQVGAEVRKATAALSAASGGEDKRILKNKLKFLTKKHTELLLKKPKDTDCFEQLGIDCLMIDEVQNFKNVTLNCGYSDISGVSIKGSHKCDINMEKVHYVLAGTDTSEGRIVFSTATPLKNSIAEQYVYQKYLQPDELNYLGMNSFKEWMKNYTEAYTKPVIDQDIQHLKMKTKLNFHNLTDLHAMISSFADFYHIENGQMNLPLCGGYQDIVIPATAAEEQVYLDIAQKLYDVRCGVVGREEYNPLLATIEGRSTALDIRLTRPEVQPEKGTTKEEACAAKVKEIYDAYPGKTQAIFCDISIPKDTFNVYDELKKDLMEVGIPEEEIAYIHDAETAPRKKRLLQAFNDGVIRVMIGSTEKLGTGLNIQAKLVAVHHYDCPWSPAQLKQRNGRIIRIGNTNREVFIFRYLKEKSYDAIIWQNVEMKMHFITDFNNYTLSERQRDTEDITDNVLSYGEAIAHALGNPKLKEHTELVNELTRTKIACRKRAVQLQQLQKIVAEIPVEIDKRDRYIETLEADIAYYSKKRTVLPRGKRKSFGLKLQEAIEAARTEGKGSVHHYQGFQVIVPVFTPEEKPYVRLRGVGGGSYKVSMETDTPLGCCQILDYYLGSSMPRIRQRHVDKCEELLRELEEANKELRKGNSYLKTISLLDTKLKKLEEELELKAG